jgi:hypothetical protein
VKNRSIHDKLLSFGTRPCKGGHETANKLYHVV